MNSSGNITTDKDQTGRNEKDENKTRLNNQQKSQKDNQKKRLDHLALLLEEHGNALAGKLWLGKTGNSSDVSDSRSKNDRQDKQKNNGKVCHGRHLEHSHLEHSYLKHKLTSSSTKTIISTGYAELDEQLHSDGWPLATSTELGLSQAGIGELRLLTPALRKLQQSAKDNIILVAPPLLPFAPAWQKEQIDTTRLTIVQTNSMQDTLWATEQALLAECCAAVLSWTGNYNLSIQELRRLQLAAEKTNSWNVLFRHSDCLKQSSAAGLRMHLKSNTYSKLDVHILKQPQGWGGQRCSLSLQPHYENWQRLPASLLPQHNGMQDPALPEQLNEISSTDHRQASVTVLASLNALRTVH